MHNRDFIELLFEAHARRKALPSALTTQRFIYHLLSLLFPVKCDRNYIHVSEIGEAFIHNQSLFSSLLTSIEPDLTKDKKILSHEFYNHLPEIYDDLLQDAMAIEAGDPAAKSLQEVIQSYPGFYAIAIYRIAHHLSKIEIPFLPRILTEYAHGKTGIDIHPSATIGKSFFIDHGTGIVIGETTIVGNHVKLYQGVTLGAHYVTKNMANSKRHPTIEDNVVVYAGATILGGNTIIGKNSIIGGNAWITKSIPENSIVYKQTEIRIKENNNEEVNRNYW